MDVRPPGQFPSFYARAAPRKRLIRVIAVSTAAGALALLSLTTPIARDAGFGSRGSASATAIAQDIHATEAGSRSPSFLHRASYAPRLLAPTQLAVRVSGNRLVNAQGHTLRLIGVDRSGTESMCEEGRGIFYGLTNQASIVAMKTWHINAVRLPLNEDCWLGINGLEPAYSGSAYRRAIEAYVARLNKAGLYVILDVHWNAPGTERARGHLDMLDASHGYTLWRSIATAFKSRPAVLFDLFNEPHNVGGTTDAEEWNCWAHGCGAYAGMDGLVSAARAAGARNVILLAGLGWASDDAGWLQHEPADPLHQIAATFHVYDELSSCTDETCWNSTLLPVAARVPLVNDEFGEVRCGEPSAIVWLNQWMSYATIHHFSMLAWTWDAWPQGCSKGPVLITNLDGSPTPFGAAVRAFYANLSRSH
jgi:endoglucanase